MPFFGSLESPEEDAEEPGLALRGTVCRAVAAVLAIRFSLFMRPGRDEERDSDRSYGLYEAMCWFTALARPDDDAEPADAG